MPKSAKKMSKRAHKSVRIYHSSIETPPQLVTTPPPKSSILPLLLVLILVIAGSLYYYLRSTYPLLFTDLTSKISNISLLPNPAADLPDTPAPTPTPSPSNYILPSGVQSYTFSHGSEVIGPKVQTVTIDPLDPAVGTTQTITLTLSSAAPVTKAQLYVQTDEKQTPLSLVRIGGDALSGEYQVSWTPDDSYNIKYSFRYLIESQNGTFDNTMYLRQ